MGLREAIEATLVWPLPSREVDPDRVALVEGDALDEAPGVDRASVMAGLEGWLDRVRTWNKKLDLTAARDDAELVELAILDAVQIAGRIALRGGAVVDVGSGFGAPGMAVAILRPDLHVKLVEPLGKRASFLRTVVGALSLVERVEVLEARGEDLAAGGLVFDAAISRATLAPDQWLYLGDQLAPHGDVVALLAREAPPEHRGRVEAFRVEYETRAGARRLAVGYSPIGTGAVGET